MIPRSVTFTLRMLTGKSAEDNIRINKTPQAGGSGSLTAHPPRHHRGPGAAGGRGVAPPARRGKGGASAACDWLGVT